MSEALKWSCRFEANRNAPRKWCPTRLVANPQVDPRLRALKLGLALLVAPVDKLSVVLVAIFGLSL
jgi:hypothetical protein